MHVPGSRISVTGLTPGGSSQWLSLTSLRSRVPHDRGPHARAPSGLLLPAEVNCSKAHWLRGPFSCERSRATYTVCNVGPDIPIRIAGDVYYRLCLSCCA